MKNMEVFHVHTYRCKHASEECDEAYVKKAVELGAERITFTDHAPFPGNPFGNRMDIKELAEYLESLRSLQEKYRGKIEIKIGLEIEYLPSYETYYQKLQESQLFDVLLLGQHFYEIAPGKYSFSLPEKEKLLYEAEGCCLAMQKGIETGYFQVIAHPDRMFRHCETWNTELEKMSQALILSAVKHNITLEKNISSMEKQNQFWPQFWHMVPDCVHVKHGIDAHAVSEVEERLLFAPYLCFI